MIFLNRKRLLVIFMCLVFSISFTTINKKNEAIETVALPVENKVIILDAGHGLPDERSFKQ